MEAQEGMQRPLNKNFQEVPRGQATKKQLPSLQRPGASKEGGSGVPSELLSWKEDVAAATVAKPEGGLERHDKDTTNIKKDVVSLNIKVHNTTTKMYSLEDDLDMIKTQQEQNEDVLALVGARLKANNV